MAEQQAFTELREALANLYEDEPAARRVARDAELTISQISFSTRAIDNWNNILLQAQKEGKAARLQTTTLGEYPGNETLINAWHNYEAQAEPPQLMALLDTAQKQRPDFWQRSGLLIGVLALLVMLVGLWPGPRWFTVLFSGVDDVLPTSTVTPTIAVALADQISPLETTPATLQPIAMPLCSLPSEVIIESGSNVSGVRAQLVEFSRFQNTITAVVRFINSASKEQRFWPTSRGYLLDEETGKKYAITEEQYGMAASIPANSTQEIWAKFRLSEGDPKYLSLLLPNGVHFDRIEVPTGPATILFLESQPIGESDSHISDICAQLVKFSRSENTITAIVRFINSASKEQSFWPTSRGYLLDEETGKKYAITEEQYGMTASIPANSAQEIWVKFRLSEENPKYLSLLLPNGVHFDHIEIR